MKFKLYSLLGCLLLASSMSHAQYRVKKVTAENSFSQTKRTYIMTLEYSEDKLNSVTINSTTHNVTRDKKGVVIGDKKRPYRTVKFDENRIKSINELSFKYRNGVLQTFTQNIPQIKVKTKLDLLYNENDKLSVAGLDAHQADMNYLLHYDTNGRCINVEAGVTGTSDRNMTAEWENNHIVKLSGSINYGVVISNHEFIYDQNGNLVEEKVYTYDKEKKEQVLRYRCLIEYEPGKGDEFDILFNYRDWRINLFFGQITFVPHVEIIY